jgi:hypothetical protein
MHQKESGRPATLASVADLQHTRLLVDSLLQRVDADDRSANELDAKEER